MTPFGFDSFYAMDATRSVLALLGGIVFALATMYALASAINGHRPSGRTTILVLAAGMAIWLPVRLQSPQAAIPQIDVAVVERYLQNVAALGAPSNTLGMSSMVSPIAPRRTSVSNPVERFPHS